MEQTGSLKTLVERMKEKTEQERIETEKIFKEQLQTLKDSLQTSSQNALHIMSDAMGQEITSVAERLSQQYRVLSLAFGRKWIGLAILGAALCLGMAIGGWALTEAWAWRLTGYQADLELLKQACQVQQQTLSNLKSQTWGLELMEDSDGRFILLPPGMRLNQKMWKKSLRNAIKLE